MQSSSGFCVHGGALVVFVIMLLGSPAATFSTELIKCKVCERAVSHVWSRGLELRRHCISVKGVDRDERCDFHGIHPWAIDRMVWGVCDALPRTYKAIHDSEFDLVLHEDPQHSDDLASLIKATCNTFVHNHHGVEVLGARIQAHLEHGHHEDSLPAITHEVCNHACARKRPPELLGSRNQKKVWTPQKDRWEEDDFGEF